MIEVQELSKCFGDCRAVDRATWTSPAGSVTGLLGANGAGKTTTIKLLLGLVHPSSGTARILGHDVCSESIVVRQFCGFVPEDKIPYPSMRCGEFLKFYGSFFPDWDATRARSLATRWQIPYDGKVRELSRGAQTKLFAAAVLARSASVLILDEPTDGLDPRSVDEILSLLVEWVAEGQRCVLLATQRLEEVERICDRVVLMDRGRVALEGDLDALRASWKRIHCVADLPAEEALKWEGVVAVAKTEHSLVITSRAGAEPITHRLAACGHTQIEVREMNLREICLVVAEGSHS